MEQSREILERVTRVRAYHQATRLPGTGDSSASSITGAAAAPQPNPFRLFEGYPRVMLPNKLVSASVPTISLLLEGSDAIPVSQMHPPSDINTLAAWLYQAAGVIQRVQGTSSWRTYPSEAWVYPCEIYVAAFAIDGLEPGFYHFSVREFALRRLRDGPETLTHLKRGRPDLEFLKNTPGCLLVSTIFCRSSWKSRRRGYRHAISDAGHVVQNLWAVALGLGIQTLVRLAVHAQSTRELIGVATDAEFADAEMVQSMVIWADSVEKPMPQGGGPTYLPGQMPTLPRPRLADSIVGFGSIMAVHEDCVAPGVAVRDIRPPLTELSPLSQEFLAEKFPDDDPDQAGQSLGRVLLNYAPPREFIRAAVSKQTLATLNRVAFRWGSAFPLHPNGAHVALVRPFWIIHDIAGLEAGIWYFNPQKDVWSSVRYGQFRFEAQQLAMGNPLFGNASAACFMVANLNRLLGEGGPDLYRLAHLEAGICAQRMNLAAASLSLACDMTGSFRDEDARRFLGIEKTGWEVIYAAAVGVIPERQADPAAPGTPGEPGIWRD